MTRFATTIRYEHHQNQVPDAASFSLAHSFIEYRFMAFRTSVTAPGLFKEYGLGHASRYVTARRIARFQDINHNFRNNLRIRGNASESLGHFGKTFHILWVCSSSSSVSHRFQKDIQYLWFYGPRLQNHNLDMKGVQFQSKAAALASQCMFAGNVPALKVSIDSTSDAAHVDNRSGSGLGHMWNDFLRQAR